MSNRKIFGNWETIKPLGRGGQGEVFQVRKMAAEPAIPLDSLMGAVHDAATPDYREKRLKATGDLVSLIQTIAAQTVAKHQEQFAALKILHEITDSSASDKAKARMGSEIATLKRYQHPALLRILDEKPVERWFVMEYFSRGTLQGHLGRFRGDVLGSLRTIRPVVEAVSEMHKGNHVHRDIKPANVFVADDGQLVLGDFGLALDVLEGDRVTGTHENVGSRDWMPSWAMGVRNEEVRPSFDVFGLAKLLWSMISGQQFLLLWYYRQPKFDIEQLFPKNPSMRWATRIFDRCVVEHEDKCLEDASKLLGLIDETINALDHGAQILRRDEERHCWICGLGNYAPASRAGDEDLRMICNYCGHVQEFVRAYSKPAWRN